MDIAALSVAAASPAVAAPLPTVPTDAVAERFAAVMNAPEAASPTAVQAALQSAFAPPAATAPATLGSQILAGLQSSAGDFSQRWRHIAAGLDQVAAAPNVADMLRVQAELLQVSVQYDLLGKAVARSTQNIDTLVRMS